MRSRHAEKKMIDDVSKHFEETLPRSPPPTTAPNPPPSDAAPSPRSLCGCQTNHFCDGTGDPQQSQTSRVTRTTSTTTSDLRWLQPATTPAAFLDYPQPELIWIP
ncbi:hypothetical protein Csa_001621 [Cucumis sativus]|uniref:Uncharacterized protein n=1 Tax=Cucumis sativus TaxID=3659 RepID=A0A0A0LA20_CUCSA|nr:hypothetical protein Csa_001621 [Cucumis sativus]